MDSNEIGIPIRRRNHQEDSFLLQSGQVIAGEQQHADGLNLRLDHVGTQALSAEYVGDETDAFAK